LTKYEYILLKNVHKQTHVYGLIFIINI